MTAAGSAAVAPATEKRTSYLELFFDLVFVFAVTQLAGLLHGDHSAPGWARAVLVAWLVWWAWSQYTWAGNAIDLERNGFRVALLAMAGLTLLAAVAIPGAFAEAGLWFALPYALVRLGGLAMYWVGLAGEPEHRAALATFLPVACLSPVLVLVGGALGPGPRLWVWAVAVVVDLVSVAAAGRGEFRVAPAHFAERHALIVIIALGESVVAVGATASGLAPTAALVATAVAGFAVVAALWWDYFDWLHPAVEHRLADEPDHRQRGHLARDLFTLGHFPLVVGTVVFAVGVEEAVAHPTEPLPAFGRLAIAVGLGLFLAGFLLARGRADRSIGVERAVLLVAVVALVALGSGLSALALVAAVAVLAVVAAAVETVSRRRAAG